MAYLPLFDMEMWKPNSSDLKHHVDSKFLKTEYLFSTNVIIQDLDSEVPERKNTFVRNFNPYVDVSTKSNATRIIMETNVNEFFIPSRLL
jgi:hypothetical protein